MKCLFGFTLARLGQAAMFLLSATLLSLAVNSAHAGPPTTSSNRFLFVVDVAAGQKTKSEEALRQSLFDLIYSGIRGYMTNGDSYGVWLAGGMNDTSGSVEVWRDKFSFELAARAALRVKDRGLKGKPCLNDALADASRVAANVGDVTVIIISDGAIPFAGTPFDSEINARMAIVADPIRQAKGAVNTVLVARDGAFVTWAVNSPEFLVSMPNLPPIKPRNTPQVAATPVASEPAKQPTLPAAETPAPPKIASKPIIITRETVDREKQVTRALATTMEGQRPTGFSSNAAPAQTNLAAQVPQANATSNAPTNTSESAPAGAVVVTTQPPSDRTAATNVAPAPAEDLANAKPVAAAVIPPPAAENASATGNVEIAAVTPETLAAPSETSFSFAPVLYAAGGGFIVLLVGALGWFFRRQKEESLISRAIAMERLQGRP